MLDKVTQPKKIKYDRDIQYAFASSRLATNWTNHNMAWSDFMQKLSSTVRTKESLLDYNKMSKTEQANVKDVGGFVGGYLKEGKRRAGQVMNRSMLTLDIDYASAGHGLNLQQGGHIIVWFGLTWSLELYQQANARLYRQGQEHTTIIHHIMTDNTIEQRVYEALQNKELTQDELMRAIKARIEKHK